MFGKDKLGYGHFSLETKATRKMMISSRVSYEITHDIDLTSDIFVCHSCDNPSCVNPKHLWLGDNKSNMADKAAKGRSPVVDGHAKINLEIAETIRKDLRPYNILTKEYGLCKSTISYIKNNKIWIVSNRT